jgi:hypothetical protein
VTESEWNSCNSLEAMLAFLRDTGRASERKLRLFAVACCRRTWHRLTDERSRRAVEVAESHADGSASTKELRFAFSCAADAYAFAVASSTADAAAAAGAANAAHADASYYATYVRPREEMLPLLRDIFGNPFRPPPAIDPSLLTPGILALAESAYSDRLVPSWHLDPARLAVLAQTLQDAGCTDAELLGHLRSPGPHVRGCHVADALLGKE